MSKINKIEVLRGLINAISGNDHYIIINKFHLDFMKDIQGAVFLSQLTFWSDKGKNKEGWIYKTYDQWLKETGIKKYKIAQLTKELENRRIIETKVMKVYGNPVKHYRLLYDNYLSEVELVLEKRQMNIEILKSERENFENRLLESENLNKEKIIKGKGNTEISVSSITEETFTEKTTEETISKDYIDLVALVTINYLNKLTNSTFEFSKRSNIKMIKDLLNENYNIIDLIEVVEKKYYEWRNDEKFKKYIRPETIFKFENFKKYLEQDNSNSIEVTPKFILIENKKNTINTILNFINEIEKQKVEIIDYEFDRLKSEIHSLLAEL